MFDEIKKILAEELQVNEDLITMDAELANDLGVNSIELADLVMTCEDKFNIEINEDDIGKFITVGDIVNYMEALKDEK
ncbi:MAG: acyl carrier protein [Eubacteriales bacterium]|jgi:acyl carrier protein|nr:acyl carrier protein [Clostridiales bacterium]